MTTPSRGLHASRASWSPRRPEPRASRAAWSLPRRGSLGELLTELLVLNALSAAVSVRAAEQGGPGPGLCYCPCNSTGAQYGTSGGKTGQSPADQSPPDQSPPDWSPDQVPGYQGDIPERPRGNPFTSQQAVTPVMSRSDDPLARPQAETCMADIAFVLDGSGSVTSANWVKMLQFVQDFAGRVTFGLTSNRMGVVSYANEARLDVKLNAYGSLAGFRQAVAAIPYSETSTNTADGIKVMRTELFTPEAGDRPSFPNIAIVMTDGESMINPEETIPEAQRAREQGIIVFAVGIGSQLKQAELEGISNNPNSQFLYTVKDFDTLINRVDDIVNAACEVTTCTRNDIAFVLDSSGSIGAINWDKVTQFVGEFVSNLAIGPESNQVGIVTYSTEAELHVRLDASASRAEIMDVVENLPWKNHRTNTAGGLRVMREGVFNELYGDRRDAPNIAIVMTDGYSNIDAAQTALEAELAKQDSVRIFVIGVGDLVEMREISAIASKPSYYYEFLLRTFDDLVFYTRRIFDVICSPVEPSPSLDFSRCRADVGFVLDGSGSVGQDNWQRMIAFMKDLAQRLDIGPSSNQIGIVTFGDDATLDVKLNQYMTTETFVAAMDGLVYKDQETNTAAGLKVLREQLFSTENGDRPDALNIAIVITDGESTVDPERTLPEAEAARLAGLTVFVIGIGSEINQAELEGIANKPASSYIYQASDFRTLLNNYERVLGSACYIASNEVWRCMFDNETESQRFCGILQEQGADQFDWTVRSGPTPSAYTGPDAAYSGLYYAYIEASSPRVEGDEARIMLPLARNLSGTYCLHFYANMFGYHVGALQVFIRRSDIDVTRWTMYGPQGQDWMDKFVDLRLQPGDQVGIRATRGHGYAGDIAIDNIRVTEGPCPF